MIPEEGKDPCLERREVTPTHGGAVTWSVDREGGDEYDRNFLIRAVYTAARAMCIIKRSIIDKITIFGHAREILNL